MTNVTAHSHTYAVVSYVCVGCRAGFEAGATRPCTAEPPPPPPAPSPLAAAHLGLLTARGTDHNIQLSKEYNWTDEDACNTLPSKTMSGETMYQAHLPLTLMKLMRRRHEAELTRTQSVR